MKLAVIALTILASTLAHGAESIEEFTKNLSGAVKSQDATKIAALYDWENVHFVFKDMEVVGWRDFIADVRDDYKFDDVLWLPIKELEPWALRSVEEWSIGENTYKTNYPAIGAFEVRFVGKVNDSDSYSEYLFVGKNKEGKFVGVSTSVIRKQGVEQGGADQPAPAPESKAE